MPDAHDAYGEVHAFAQRLAANLRHRARVTRPRWDADAQAAPLLQVRADTLDEVANAIEDVLAHESGPKRRTRSR